MIDVITIVCDGNPNLDDATDLCNLNQVSYRPSTSSDEALEVFVDHEQRNSIVKSLKALHYDIIEG